MIISIVGMIIGILMAAAGVFYLLKEKNDKDSRKIYGSIAGLGVVVFAGALIKLLVTVL